MYGPLSALLETPHPILVENQCYFIENKSIISKQSIGVICYIYRKGQERKPPRREKEKARSYSHERTPGIWLYWCYKGSEIFLIMQQKVVAEVARKVKAYGIPQIKLSYAADREAENRYGDAIKDSASTARMLRQWWDADTLTYTESLVALLLNRRNKVIGILPISEGSTEACLFDIRKLVTAALIANASGVILSHNHPSGNLRPSIQDDNLTRKARQALESLDIRLLDHIILTDESHYSYADEGKLIF